MRRNWVIALLTAVILVLGWRTWRAEQLHRRQLEAAVQRQVMMANSAIFDANWALQQVKNPAAPESAPLIRRSLQLLISARERLGALQDNLFYPFLPTEENQELSEIIQVSIAGLDYKVTQGDFALFERDRHRVAVISEHLPFPQHDLKQFRKGVAALTEPREGASLLEATPPTPPAMQVTVQGSYAPVKLGGYCWLDEGRTHCVDRAGPAQLLAEVDPAQAKPGAPVELRFAWAPRPGSIKLLRHLAPEQQEPVPLSPNLTFTLPQESGLYIYHAEAAWEQGSGTYAFKVLVR